MKVELYNEKFDRVYHAQPYHHETKDTDAINREKILAAGGEEKVTFHRLMEPYIVDSENTFFTKTFFVRYAEELIVLRDIIKFRSEIDVAPGYLETEFFLKVELYY